MYETPRVISLITLGPRDLTILCRSLIAPHARCTRWSTLYVRGIEMALPVCECIHCYHTRVSVRMQI